MGPLLILAFVKIHSGIVRLHVCEALLASTMEASKAKKACFHARAMYKKIFTLIEFTLGLSTFIAEIVFDYDLSNIMIFLQFL